MDYSFNLNWYDLPEELREEKIEEVKSHWISNGDLDEDMTEEEKNTTIESYIAGHFPLYF